MNRIYVNITADFQGDAGNKLPQVLPFIRCGLVTDPGQGRVGRERAFFRLKTQRRQSKINILLKLAEPCHIPGHAYPDHLYPPRVRKNTGFIYPEMEGMYAAASFF